MKRFHLLGIAILVCSLLIGTCAFAAPIDLQWSGLPKEVTDPVDFGLDKAEVAAKNFTIGFAQCVLDHPWRISMCEQAEAWSKEYGVNYIQMDGQGNPAIEVSNIESLIAKKVDAIVISSHGGVALTPALIQAAEQKIPVILIDGGKPFEDWEFVTWMSTDDEEMGILTAELIAKDLKGKGKVALLEGTSGSSCTEGRAIGYDRYMAQFPDIKTVARQDANWLRKNAIDILTNVLQANPDLSAVYGHNDEITLGAIEAIEAAGKKPGVDILVYSAGDYQTSGLEAIKIGKLRSTMAYHNDGDWAMEAAVAYLMGKPVPKFINLGTSMATIDNVDTQTPAY